MHNYRNSTKTAEKVQGGTAEHADSNSAYGIYISAGYYDSACTEHLARAGYDPAYNAGRI